MIQVKAPVAITVQLLLGGAAPTIQWCFGNSEWAVKAARDLYKSLTAAPHLLVGDVEELKPLGVNSFIGVSTPHIRMQPVC